MTERRTGRYVRLELVWRHNYVWLGKPYEGVEAGWVEPSPGGWDAGICVPSKAFLPGTHPTRAAAERAVEDAVIQRMGGVDG